MNRSSSATIDSPQELSAAGESPDTTGFRRQLEVLRYSRAFQRSARLMAFLEHIVEAKLAGELRDVAMIRRTDNARVSQRSEECFLAHDSRLRPGEEPPLASHLVTPRALYTHHGIYIGKGRVIHYAGLAYRWRRGPVEDVPLERFANGHDVRVRRGLHRFDPFAVVERARSRLGERRYRLLTNNCEHFCAWALRGESRSSQVERLGGVPRAICHAIWARGQRVLGQHRAIARAFLWTLADVRS